MVTGRVAEAVTDGDWLKAPVLRHSRHVLLDFDDQRRAAAAGADVGSAAELRREFANEMRERGATEV